MPKPNESKVGIFWLVESELLIDGVSLAVAEKWGKFLNYPLGHKDKWECYRQTRAVPADVEYDTPPRGRVVFDSVWGLFYLYADACILRKPALINEIRERLRLPPETRVGRDEHYRCADCLGVSGL